MQTTRTFQDKPATRESVPLLVGLYGPSGSGKTYSALELATGIQSVTGGEIYIIDTESRRALHYAELFKFRHVQFDAPFSPLDYLAAIEHCIKKGAKTVIVDSMSHEHEGPSGVLEMHESEVERLSKGDPAKAGAVNFLAWAKPKAERRRLLNSILQMNANFIFCFRAKEKIRMPDKGKGERDAVPLGFMPIAGDEYVYEMVLNVLLLPNSGGIPEWHPDHIGEKACIKLPIQFKQLFSEKRPLSRSHGAALAQWAAGGSSMLPPIATGPPLSLTAQPPTQSSHLTKVNPHRIGAMIDKFKAVDVTPAMIEQYLDHAVSDLNEVELKQMQEIYRTINDGSRTWASWMEKI